MLADQRSSGRDRNELEYRSKAEIGGVTPGRPAGALAMVLTKGLYHYSCNPRYLTELVIWVGWIVFYGSFVLTGVFTGAALLVGPVIVPCEELGLEARFGDVYREFRGPLARRGWPRLSGRSARGPYRQC